jgi:hypothetical protein
MEVTFQKILVGKNERWKEKHVSLAWGKAVY